MKKDESSDILADLSGLGKVRIYVGTINKLYKDDFSLFRNKPAGITKDTRTEKNPKLPAKQGYFYIKTKGSSTEYVSIDYGRVLPNRATAMKKCDELLAKNIPTLMNALSRVKDPKEQHRIFDAVTKDTEVPYIYSADDIKFYQEMPKKKLKSLLESRNSKQNKNKK